MAALDGDARARAVRRVPHRVIALSARVELAEQRGGALGGGHVVLAPV
jgi:hypothetical protein